MDCRCQSNHVHGCHLLLFLASSFPARRAASNFASVGGVREGHLGYVQGWVALNGFCPSSRPSIPNYPCIINATLPYADAVKRCIEFINKTFMLRTSDWRRTRDIGKHLQLDFYVYVYLHLCLLLQLVNRVSPLLFIFIFVFRYCQYERGKQKREKARTMAHILGIRIKRSMWGKVCKSERQKKKKKLKNIQSQTDVTQTSNNTTTSRHYHSSLTVQHLGKVVEGNIRRAHGRTRAEEAG